MMFFGFFITTVFLSWTNAKFFLNSFLCANNNINVENRKNYNKKWEC